MSAQPMPLTETKSRLVLTEGGKGGTGKTCLVAALVDWYDERGYDYTLIDLDTEASKTRGSLVHFFPSKASKVDMHQPEALDTLLNALQDGPPIVIADLGAGSGHAAYAWCDAIYEGA
jgi:MinD-like ATPase involved in chromosome partitioning or flagellar assembly